MKLLGTLRPEGEELESMERSRNSNMKAKSWELMIAFVYQIPDRFLKYIC